MLDLSTQLREYFDATAPPQELDTIVTDQVWVDPESQTRRQGRMVPAWAYGLGALVLVLVVALSVNLLLAGDQNEVVEPTPTTVAEPTPTTVAPDAEAMTDLEVIEAGAAAFYSGDAERAAALFELPDRTDEEIRQESAYQAAIDGRVNLDCTESTPGTFSCNIRYGNALIDAAAAKFEDQHIYWLNRTVEDGVIQEGPQEGPDARVVVENGVITDFVFPESPTVNIQLGSFLAAEGRLEGYEDCVFGPLTESCAVIQLENLDAWAEWQATQEEDSDAWKVGMITSALTAWYEGDCLGAHYLAGEMLYVDGEIGGGYRDGADALCPSSASSTQTIEYESILGAEVTVEGCESAGGFDWARAFDGLRVYQLIGDRTCTVQYSNAMNSAVGKSPAVTVRDGFLASSTGLLFTVHPDNVDWTEGLVAPGAFTPWYVQGAYPEDTELRESFKQFAESGELADEYAAADCANQRTPDCAHLIMDNLDDWASWHQANS